MELMAIKSLASVPSEDQNSIEKHAVRDWMAVDLLTSSVQTTQIYADVSTADIQKQIKGHWG